MLSPHHHPTHSYCSPPAHSNSGDNWSLLPASISRKGELYKRPSDPLFSWKLLELATIIQGTSIFFLTPLPSIQLSSISIGEFVQTFEPVLHKASLPPDNIVSLSLEGSASLEREEQSSCLRKEERLDCAFPSKPHVDFLCLSSGNNDPMAFLARLQSLIKTWGELSWAPLILSSSSVSGL